MANVHELPVQPAEDTMADVLHALFANSLHGRVEIAWIGSGSAIGARLFDLTMLDEAAAYAARANALAGRNVYFSAGLRSESADENKRGTKDDVIALAAIKVDCDEPGCLTTALNIACDAGFPPNIALYTGRTPSLRGSLWWVLDEPCTEKDRCERLEQRLIALFGADRLAWNADRIMRLPGSVAWPTKPGRIVEMTGVYDAVTRVPHYAIEEIENAVTRIKPSASDQESHLDLSTAKQSVDVAALLEAAKAPGDFHKNARPAIMSLVRRGAPPEVIVEILSGAIAMAGVNVQQRTREMTNLVRGAVRKVVADETPTEAPLSPPGRDPFPLIANADIADKGPPEWAIPGFLPRRGFGVLYGPSGAFKSFIALDLALTVAYGLPWRGHEVQQLPAAYIAGEGTHGVPSRIVAWRENRQQDPNAPVFWLAPVAANFLDPSTVKLIGERLSAVGAHLIVVDTLARSFGGGNENEAQDMNKFVAACDYLRDVCDAFVLAVHHTGKDGDRGARGSSVLRAAADVEISVSRGTGEQSAIISVTKMKDAEDGARVGVRMVQVESISKLTGEVIDTLVPVLADDVSGQRKGTLKMGRNERSVMSALSSVYPLKFGQLKAMTGIENGSLGRAIRSLLEKGLVSQDGDAISPTSGVLENEQFQGDET